MSNYKFKTVNIRGKKYVEVKERVKYFRQEKKYEGWSIETDFTVLDGEQCVCKTTVSSADGQVIATGHAHELRNSSSINKTSYIENCETSSIGRALAVMGIGVDDSMASAGEVSEAIAKQSEPAKKPNVKPSAISKDKPSPPVDNIMDKAVGYIKTSGDKNAAFDMIMKKYSSQLSDKQVEGLKKFVR